MNNIVAGANGVAALRDAPISSMGLTAANTTILFRINPLASWRPGSGLNSLQNIVKDESYYLVSKTAHDLSPYFSSPLNRSMDSISFESQGIRSTNTAAQNKAALQAAINTLSANGGGVLSMTKNYPMDVGIVAKSNVKIVGNAWSEIKGPTSYNGVIRGGIADGQTPTQKPANACFEITSAADSVFKVANNIGFTLYGVGFNYSNQPLLTTSPSTALIQYPPTIACGDGVFSTVIKHCYFLGAWSFVEFTGACADILIEGNTGYPLSGRGFYIKTCYDIPRVNNNMFSPSIGNYMRQVPATNIFTVHSIEVARHVMNTGKAFIEFDYADEFYASGNFAYAYPTFIKVFDSYGTLVQNNCDIGRIGLDLNCNHPVKHITVLGFSAIGSAGTDPSTRNTIVIRGEGYYNLNSITPRLGITVWPALQPDGANQNSVVRIEGTGAPVVTIFGMKGSANAGSGAVFTHDIQKVNAAAVLDVHGLDIPNATNKIAI